MGYKVPPQVRPPQKEGTNRRLLMNALEAWNLPKIDIKDPAAIEQRIGEYLQHCAEKDVCPSVAGCTNWLGISINMLRWWYEGKYGTPAHQQVAAKFYAVMQEIWAQDMHEGNINPVSGIFIGKAFYGYKDTQEIVVKQNAAQDQMSNADLIAESQRLPGAERLALPEGTQTIDVDAKIVPSEAYERSVERNAAIQKRKEEREANKMYPTKKEYLKHYYQEHKEEYYERKRKAAERRAQKEAAERAARESAEHESDD